MPRPTVEEAQQIAASDRHWDFFAQFCHWEMAAGGPDPHMVLAGYLTKGLPFAEQLWRAGCYVGVYNVPSAEAIWRDWPWPKVLEKPIEPWLRENWKGLRTRRERRCVRTPEKMARFFNEYAQWIADGPMQRHAWGENPRANFDWLWNEADDVAYLGRYVRFKIFEFYKRYLNVPLDMPDIRPDGGWSPRLMLAILRPEHAALLLGEDSPEAFAGINAVAEETRQQMCKAYDLKMDTYIFEVMLCDYRQCYFGKRQYPGRSQDSELEYAHSISSYWGNKPTQIWDSRAEIFPHEVLGEHSGWNHVRKELGAVLRDYRYMWTDLKYDYIRTEDLARPWER